MKKILAHLLSLSLLAVSCSLPSFTPSPTAPPQPQHDPFDAPWQDRSMFKTGLIPTAQSALEGMNGASVYHMDLNIADDLLQVTGRLEVWYTNREDVPLDEVQFRLFPNILGGRMQISNLRVDGTETLPRYGLNNSLMIVPLTGRLDMGKSMILQMDFAVGVPDSLEKNYGVLAYAEGVLALAHAYPMVAVYDDEGWNAEVPAQDGDLTYTDASFYLVRITAPKELTLVTSGIEISRTEAGQAQVLTVAGGPARDFYLAASVDYAETSQNFGGITIRSFAPDGYQNGSQTALEIAARAVEIFSRRYAAYPYTQLDLVATPTLAFGIEYPGMIAITSWTYDLSDLHTQTYLESTIVHEVAHQWFYNLVGDDQLDDPWLDESLAQFATLQYYSDEYGAEGYDGFRASLDGRWARVGYAKIPIGLPVAQYRNSEYGAIVYGRGPLFFVALQEAMGLDEFDAFIKEYAGTLSWEISTPEILQSLAEKHCACELDLIFNQWVYPIGDQ